MPSSLTDFSSTSRKLRPKLGVDLGLTGTYTDYTNFLDNYTIISTSSDKICGLYETYLDAELWFDSPSLEWTKPGRPLLAKMLISSDSWVTSYTEVLFTGSTTKQNSVPVNSVKIKATTLNSDYLSKRTARQLFQNIDIADIMESLLLEVGVDPADISLTATGKVLPVYAISSSKPISFYIEDLAKATLSLVGFDKDGVFRAKSLSQFTLGGAITPDLTVNLGQTLEFQSRDIESKYYSNSLKIKGYNQRAIVNGQLYYNNQLQGFEIEPLSKLYFTLELPDIVPISIAPFTTRLRPVIGKPIGFGFTPLNSFFDFFENDDGSGAANNNSITLKSTNIVEDNGKDVLLLIFENASPTFSFFLKTILS